MDLLFLSDNLPKDAKQPPEGGIFYGGAEGIDYI